MQEQFVVCSRDCACHRGARYDQIECICEWFCGHELSDVKDAIKKEKYTVCNH